MKWLLAVLLMWIGSLSVAQEAAKPYDLKIKVHRLGGLFQVDVSFQAPINRCNAYAFLTDYEAAKNIPGIVESKVIARSGNKATIERVVEERILLIPIEMHSVVEYTELINQGVNFKQISGDARSYEGTWRLDSRNDYTTFKYDSTFEPQSSLPNFIIEYFIKNSMRDRFATMAEMASQRYVNSTQTCQN
jgi:hypothetical protein